MKVFIAVREQGYYFDSSSKNIESVFASLESAKNFILSEISFSNLKFKFDEVDMIWFHKGLGNSYFEEYTIVEEEVIE